MTSTLSSRQSLTDLPLLHWPLDNFDLNFNPNKWRRPASKCFTWLSALYQTAAWAFCMQMILVVFHAWEDNLTFPVVLVCLFALLWDTSVLMNVQCFPQCNVEFHYLCLKETPPPPPSRTTSAGSFFINAIVYLYKMLKHLHAQVKRTTSCKLRFSANFFNILPAGPVKGPPCLLCSCTGKCAPFHQTSIKEFEIYRLQLWKK